MPLYEFKCPIDDEQLELLRKLGDTTPPICPKCNHTMERVFNSVTSIFKGAGWTNGVYTQLKNRSREQGKKFFKKHDDLQNLSEKYISESNHA